MTIYHAFKNINEPEYRDCWDYVSEINNGWKQIKMVNRLTELRVYAKGNKLHRGMHHEQNEQIRVFLADDYRDYGWRVWWWEE